MTIERPELWWPRALGDPDAPRPPGGGRARRRRGRWRLRRPPPAAPGCARCACAPGSPASTASGCSSRARTTGRPAWRSPTPRPRSCARDVELACDAGLDLLRIHAHITRPELYDAADEAGLLLWQDLPLQWGYARGHPQAGGAAGDGRGRPARPPPVDRDLVRPQRADGDRERPVDVGRAEGAAPHGRCGPPPPRSCPTWNKTVLDRSVKRALEKADGTRPVIAHSGVLPHPPQLDGTDSHLYFGWYHGHERDFPGFLRAMPRMARFVTEFGAQAVPAERRVLRAGALARPRLGPPRPHPRACSGRCSTGTCRPADHATFDEWRAATQAYQAVVVRRHIEALRRIKYRPTGGFAQFCFADGHPAVTWSVLGHDRSPEGGVRRAARGVPAGDRRRRPAARAGDRRARPSPSTSTW